MRLAHLRCIQILTWGEQRLDLGSILLNVEAEELEDIPTPTWDPACGKGGAPRPLIRWCRGVASNGLAEGKKADISDLDHI